MERKTISAHELNKYTYCPYQWYYERLYGRKELRRRYQERNERLALEDHLTSHFLQGEAHHQKEFIRWRRKNTLWKVGIILLSFVFLAGYMVMRYGMGA